MPYAISTTHRQANAAAWDNHLMLYVEKLSTTTCRTAKRCLISELIAAWEAKGGTFVDRNGVLLIHSEKVRLARKCIKNQQKRLSRGQQEIIRTTTLKTTISRTETSNNDRPVEIEEDGCLLRKVQPDRQCRKPRRIVGHNIVFVETNDGQLKKEIIQGPSRTSIKQLRDRFHHKGMVSVFVVNPNVATTLNKDIIPANKTMVCIILVDGVYRIGIIEGKGTQYCNLEYVHLLLWNGSVQSFLTKEGWNVAANWTRHRSQTAQQKVDGGYVNLIFGQGVQSHEDDYILMRDSPDFCSLPCFEETTVVYCRIPLKNNLPNLHGNSGETNVSLVSIPIGFPTHFECSTEIGKWKEMKNSAKNREFVELSVYDLKEISRQYSGKNRDDFYEAVKQRALMYNGLPFSRLVINFGRESSRLVVLDPQEFDTMLSTSDSPYEHVRHFSRGVQYEYIVTKVKMHPNDVRSPGVCLATMQISDEIQKATDGTLSYKNSNAITLVLGQEGHKRPCTDHVGHSSFRGCCRATERPNPSPAVEDSNVAFQAYYDSSKLKNLIGLIGVEQVLLDLEQCAMASAQKMQPALLSIPSHELSDRRIVTCGLTSIWKRCVRFLGFCNGEHVDVNDLKNQDEFRVWSENSCYRDYMLRMLDMVDCGNVTTCQYRHLWKNVKESGQYEVDAFFMHHGVGIAHPLKDCSSVSFLGFAYSHCTSLCLLIDCKDNTVVLENSKDTFNMFAWGTGGNSNRRRRRFIALGGDGNDVRRLTQARMDNFLEQAVEQFTQGDNDNEHIAAYVGMPDEQREAFARGLALGQGNTEDPTQIQEDN